MIYLIGGPARCGKSMLAERVRREIDGQVVAGDAFVHALRDNLSPEWMPDIFDQVDSVHDIKEPKAKVERLRRRDLAVWPFYKSYIATAIADAPHDNVLIEGNIWPDSLASLTSSYKAVFLVDTSSDQAERLISIRDSNGDNDWMRNFTDDKLVEWAKFNIVRSELYILLCKQNQSCYFDIAEHGIAHAQQLAFEYLMKNAV